MRKTLLQTLYAAFCAILCGTSALGGGGMIIGTAEEIAHNYAIDKARFWIGGEA